MGGEADRGEGGPRVLETPSRGSGRSEVSGLLPRAAGHSRETKPGPRDSRNTTPGYSEGRSVKDGDVPDSVIKKKAALPHTVPADAESLKTLPLKARADLIRNLHLRYNLKFKRKKKKQKLLTLSEK